MITTPRSSADESASLPRWRWWLSLYPRLSVRGKRGGVACLGAALLIQSVGVLGSPRQSPGSQAGSPAVQNALEQLGLPALLDPVGNQFQVNSYYYFTIIGNSDSDRF